MPTILVYLYSYSYTRPAPRVENTRRRRYRYLYTDTTWLHAVSRLACELCSCTKRIFRNRTLAATWLPSEPPEPTFLPIALLVSLYSENAGENVQHILTFISATYPVGAVLINLLKIYPVRFLHPIAFLMCLSLELFYDANDLLFFLSFFLSFFHFVDGHFCMFVNY